MSHLMSVGRRASILFVLALLSVITLTTNTVESQDVAQPRVVRLSFGSGWDTLPALVSIERGFFADQDLIVSGLAVSSAAAVLESITAGSSDFALLPQRAMLVMAAADVSAKVVAMSDWGTEMEIVVPAGDQRLKELVDLKGKTIAVGAASEAFSVLIRLLNAKGLQPDDVTIRQYVADDLMNALKQGAADAIIESRHFTETLVESGQARVLIGDPEIVSEIGKIGASPLVARTKLIEEEPDTVQRFVSAWVAGLNYISNDPEDAARILRIFFHRQGVRVSEEQALSWVKMKRYDRAVWTDNDVTDAEYNGWGLVTGQILKVQPELDGFIDNRFARKAVADSNQ